MTELTVLPPQISRVLRRLRVAYRHDPDVYAVLRALEDLAMSGIGQELATASGGRDDCRVTVLQAARKAGLSPRTIVRAISSGELEAWKTGPIWQITEKSLQRWLARRERAERGA